MSSVARLAKETVPVPEIELVEGVPAADAIYLVREAAAVFREAMLVDQDLLH
jgi:hypothetical protein